MAGTVMALAAPLLVLIVTLFLTVRLRLFSSVEIGGRQAFVWGGILLFIAALWQTARLSASYQDWFVASAYPTIDLAQLLVAGAGGLLMVIGIALYADYWQTRREDMDERLARLSILEHIQQDARQPYHLLDLLNLALHETLAHWPDASGALFLVNRSQRRFVLSSSVALTREENALLEYYPLGRNVVSQALDLGDPMLVTRFEMFDRSGNPTVSRFNSCLILPLVSGVEKIGVLLLLAEDKQFFGRPDIRYLAPVAQWLAEKIRSARLARDLAQTESRAGSSAETLNRMLARVSSCCAAMTSGDPIAAYCRSLVGVAGCESVHLCGLRRGELVFHGSSEPITDLSENYRTALVDALDRSRPLIINQESADEGAAHTIARSSLVQPLGTSDGHEALLMIRTDRAFAAQDQDLREIESLANLARVVLKYDHQRRLSLARRKGFDAVLDLLKADTRPGGLANDPGLCIRHLMPILPPQSVMLVFAADEKEALILREIAGAKTGEAGGQIRILPGEGGPGQAARTQESVFLYGRSNVSRQMETYHQQNRELLNALFGERGLPLFTASLPVIAGHQVAGVVMICAYDVDEKETGEWERLLKLAAGLYSLRLTIDQVTVQEPVPSADAGVQYRDFARIANQLNNCFSATIGIAELAARQENVPGDLRARLEQIVEETEAAALLVKTSMTSEGAAVPADASGGSSADDVNTAVADVLARTRVSGDLYMAGQRPREIRAHLSAIGAITFAGDKVRKLFESVLNRFSSMADEDDVITVTTYVRDKYAYLDVSRHRRNFPPVEPVVDFGQYQHSQQAFGARPGDVFLRHLDETDSFYAFDRTSAVPAYLSFRFPVRPRKAAPSDTRPAGGADVKILAIDDQAVILDLISAMGQSLGYSVSTASTAAEGLRLARGQKYDIILTDLAMPGMSGLELSRQVHNQQPDTPVILVTGWETHLEQRELASLGIIEVLYKPFRIEQLMDIVQAAVRSSARF
jgi:CheY-like chemotaxis protein